MNSTTPLRTTTTTTKTSSATDMSRRMVCGGLAGMIAKVIKEFCYCCCDVIGVCNIGRHSLIFSLSRFINNYRRPRIHWNALKCCHKRAKQRPPTSGCFIALFCTRKESWDSGPAMAPIYFASFPPRQSCFAPMMFTNNCCQHVAVYLHTKQQQQIAGIFGILRGRNVGHECFPPYVSPRFRPRTNFGQIGKIVRNQTVSWYCPHTIAHNPR